MSAFGQEFPESCQERDTKNRGPNQWSDHMGPELDPVPVEWDEE